MSVNSTEESAAYKEAIANKAALGYELFRLLVKREWYGTLTVALRDYTAEGDYYYLDEPDFNNADRRDFYYLGCWEAREYLSAALGEPIDDERFKKLVEEVLRDELVKYHVKLCLETRHNWDGSDQVLRIYPKA